MRNLNMQHHSNEYFTKGPALISRCPDNDKVLQLQIAQLEFYFFVVVVFVVSQLSIQVDFVMHIARMNIVLGGNI